MFKKSAFFTPATTFAALSVAFAAPTTTPTNSVPTTTTNTTTTNTTTVSTTTQEITTRVGRGADASIQGGESAAKNFGTTFLWAKNGFSINYARKMYLRFDLANLSQPLKSLENATLRLTMAAPNGASPADKDWVFRVWGVPDADAGENWDEKTLTWENAPLNLTVSGKDLKAEAIALGSFSIKGMGSAGDTVTFSSPELAKWLQSDTNKIATLILTRDATETGTTDNVAHVFLPKEQSKQPLPTLALSFKTP